MKLLTKSIPISIILILVFSLARPVTVLADIITGTADWVYGQPDFISDTGNNGGISTDSLRNPIGIVLDNSENLYVADYSNHRVLFYPAGETSATRVYGQGGDFTSATINNGGLSADSLKTPNGIALDNSGNLYVSDSGNHRVLYYPAGVTTATRVYGQPDFISNTQNNGGISADSLSGPFGVALDNIENLYVADNNNNRVLYYPAGVTTATRVYGQGGNFTSATQNNGGISADSLSRPNGVALDNIGNLYVADGTNNRVLYYPAGVTTATRIYGQPDFTSNTLNNGGISADSLSRPTNVALDNSGNLYVADRQNDRVLYYPAGDTTATRVYGQGGDFTSATSNNGGISADSLDTPNGITLDNIGNLYVSDQYNHRVLTYNIPETTEAPTTPEAPAPGPDGAPADGPGGTFVNSPGGDFTFNGGTVSVPPGAVPDGTQLFADFTRFPPQVNGMWSLNGVVDITLIGPGGNPITSFNPPLEVCLPYTAEDLAQVGGNTNNLRVGWAEMLGDAWNLVATYVKPDEMLACARINHLTIFGLFEPLLPATGFAPGVVTDVGGQMVDYFNMDTDRAAMKAAPTQDGGMTLEIPSLGVNMPITGVPESGDGWDVTWLGEQAGWLNSTAFPTMAGNTAITGHVVDVAGRAGPFSMLHTLWWGDVVKVHAWGQTYTYEVRSAVMTAEDNLNTLKHEELDWITLITCRGYDAQQDAYPWRTVVRAVLVDVK